MVSKLSYCGELVRVQDRDRFLISMLAPPSGLRRDEAAAVREALWALFAFNYEIAKTREVVSETQLGLIRLQWWHEAIAAIYEGGEVLENEVLPALAEAIRMYDLPQEHFDALIYAREFDLEDVRPGNVEGVVNYADFTHTPLMKLALLVCGADPEVEPVQPVATSYALMGVLRAVVFHAGQKRCYLPDDLMNQHAVRGVYDFRLSGNLDSVIEAVSEEIVLGVQSDAKILKYMQKLTKIYLRQLKSVKYDVFSPRWALSPAFKEIRLIF